MSTTPRLVLVQIEEEESASPAPANRMSSNMPSECSLPTVRPTSLQESRRLATRSEMAPAEHPAPSLGTPCVRRTRGTWSPPAHTRVLSAPARRPPPPARAMCRSGSGALEMVCLRGLAARCYRLSLVAGRLVGGLLVAHAAVLCWRFARCADWLRGTGSASAPRALGSRMALVVVDLTMTLPLKSYTGWSRYSAPPGQACEMCTMSKSVINVHL